MKARTLLNMQVVTVKDEKGRGLVRDIRVKDHKIEMLILSFGGIFSKGLYILPSEVINIDYDHMEVENERALHRAKAKEIKELISNTYSLFNTPVKDVEENRFAKVADATITPDLAVVVEYDLSRSFFDDLDYGYSLVKAEQMHFEENALIYERTMFEMEKTQREGGILQKILGEDSYENITR